MNHSFTQFWSGLDADEKVALAKRAGTSVGYLKQVATGHRNAGTKTINALLKADKRVSLDMFFKAA